MKKSRSDQPGLDLVFGSDRPKISGENIFFTKQPEAMRIDGRGICIYHRYYEKRLPAMPGCDPLEFSWFCNHFQDRDFFDGMDLVVFVGANKFFNSSTRFHPVFDLLQYGLPARIRKIVVDIAPYVGPIWRIWPHFSLACRPFDGYTYSYLIESHYNAFLDGIRKDNPVSLERIRENARGAVFIDYARYFPAPAVQTIEMSKDVHAGYQKLKAELFEDYDQIGKIIKGLSDFAKEACPERIIPQEHKIFETPDRVCIVRTDLKVDTFLSGKLLEKIDEVNRVVEVLR